MSHKRWFKFGLLILPLFALHKHHHHQAGFFRHWQQLHGQPRFWRSAPVHEQPTAQDGVPGGV